MPFTPFKKGHAPVKKSTTPTNPQKKVPPGPIPQTPTTGKTPAKGPFGQALDQIVQGQAPPMPKKKARKKPPAGPPKPGY